jgi:ABC-2 type transport system ATP-binding protein
MESVEEMCDHIALFHKSNKLIEGKLTDVKKQYRTNNYEVGILTDNPNALVHDLSQYFKLAPTEFKSLNDELKLEINLGTATPNDLLSALVQKGQVTHFMEKIPSVNDIFIQTVSQK